MQSLRSASDAESVIQIVKADPVAFDEPRKALTMLEGNKAVSSKILELATKETQTAQGFMSWCTSSSKTVEDHMELTVKHVESQLREEVTTFQKDVDALHPDATSALAQKVKVTYEQIDASRKTCQEYLAMVLENPSSVELPRAQEALEQAEAASTVWGVAQLLSRKRIDHKDKGKENREKLKKIYETRVKGNKNAEAVLTDELKARLKTVLEMDEPVKDPPAKKAKKGK